MNGPYSGQMNFLWYKDSSNEEPLRDSFIGIATYNCLGESVLFSEYDNMMAFGAIGKDNANSVDSSQV